jgi:hypothetical protein
LRDLGFKRITLKTGAYGLRVILTIVYHLPIVDTGELGIMSTTDPARLKESPPHDGWTSFGHS